VNVFAAILIFGLGMLMPVHGLVIFIGRAAEPVKAILKKVAVPGGGDDETT
jgi:hypothetical protein